MKKELKDKLYEDFGDYLINENGHHLSLDVNDGWALLISEAIVELKKNNCNLVFTQIKQKLGTIRMYYSPKYELSKFQKNYNKMKTLILNLFRFINHPFLKLNLYRICSFNYRIFYNIDKFFGLRIFRFKSYIVDNIIRKAEVKSSHTCEICGNSAKIANDRWMCICDKCLINRNIKELAEN